MRTAFIAMAFLGAVGALAPAAEIQSTGARSIDRLSPAAASVGEKCGDDLANGKPTGSERATAGESAGVQVDWPETMQKDPLIWQSGLREWVDLALSKVPNERFIDKMNSVPTFVAVTKWNPADFIHVMLASPRDRRHGPRYGVVGVTSLSDLPPKTYTYLFSPIEGAQKALEDSNVDRDWLFAQLSLIPTLPTSAEAGVAIISAPDGRLVYVKFFELPAEARRRIRMVAVIP